MMTELVGVQDALAIVYERLGLFRDALDHCDELAGMLSVYVLQHVRDRDSAPSADGECVYRRVSSHLPPYDCPLQGTW